MESGWLEIWRFHGCALLLGCLIDWAIGDPRWLPHPVRGMGWVIAWLERRLLGSAKQESVPDGQLESGGQRRQLFAGIALVLVMCLFWTLVPLVLLTAAERLLLGSYPLLLLLAEGFFCSQLLAARGLSAESMNVCRALRAGDTEGARHAVSMIVGRDTAVLDRSGIARAAVETVAENASDGVVAPFLFMAVLGPVGGFLYKAVNTMDSMVGYRNERYLLFGRAAARLDDLANFIPARLTGTLICLAAWLLPGYDGRQAWRIFLRDRRKHASPNSAHGEAACAGALGLRLAGDAWYFGELHKKLYIGDERRAIEAEDIARAGRLMYAAEVTLMAAFAVVMALI